MALKVEAPLFLLFCISQSVSFLKGGGERRTGGTFVGGVWETDGCEMAVEVMGNSGHAARGVLATEGTRVARRPKCGLVEAGRSHRGMSPA